ncbi:MAG: alpha/beta hydrolase [Elusimicrobiaceae bacterium]|jgi:pimeloyl-ACP methyl ester carboxylesterase
MPYFKHDNCETYFETEGEGFPLVLTHGFCSDITGWEPVRKTLAKTFKLIMPDNRFAGRTKTSGEESSTKLFAEDIKALLDFLQIEKAIILGHSLGGYIAQEFAAAYPEKTEKLVLVSTAAVSSKRNNLLISAFAQLHKVHGNSELFWRNAYPWLLSPRMFDNVEAFENILAFTVKYPYLPSPENFARQKDALISHNSETKLSAIKADALVLSGGMDFLITTEESRQMANRIPRVKFEFIKNSGHNIPFEMPEPFTQAIVRFAQGN